ncbi:MAG: PAS domain S-box protein [Chloroflexi bacterium]|nr:PAS domain S-box protein [Chloroflexota bacterium]
MTTILEYVHRVAVDALGTSGSSLSPRLLEKALQTMTIGVTITNVDGRIVYTNRADAEMHGYTVEELIGQPARVFGTAPQARPWSDIAQMHSWLRETVNLRKDGSSFPVLLLSDAVTDADGRPLGVVTTCQDISERKLAEEAVRVSETRLRRITDNMLDVISEVDLSGIIQYASPSHQWVLGYDAGGMIGQVIIERVHPDDAPDARATLLHAPASLSAPGPVVFRYRHADGHYVWMECLGRVLHDERGQASGLVLSSRDVTARKRAEAELQRLNEELEQRVGERTAALEAANAELRRDFAERQRIEHALRESETRYRLHFANVHDVIFAIDGQARVISISPSVEATLGYAPDALIGRSFSELNVLAPESLVRAIGDAQRVLAGERVTAEYTFVRRDGEQRIGEVTGAPLHSETGAIIGVVSVARDITDRKRVEAALRESEERYALAAQGANDGLWDWNLLTGQIYFSPRWKAMLGLADQAPGTSPEAWFALVHPDDLADLQSHLSAHLEGRRSSFEVEYRIRHADGEFRWMLSRALAVRSSEGQACRLTGSQTDITRRKMAEERLLHDALHEPLTGLANRALFMRRLSRAIDADGGPGGSHAAVLFFDLDRFKLINDSLGHQIGDRLLVAVARRIEATVRAGDMIARFGGDEFALLVNDINAPPDAALTAERLLCELTQPFPVDGHMLAPSASVGIALTRRNASPDEIMREADTAMYRAKAQGRARYEIYDAGMHSEVLTLLETEADLRRAIAEHEFELHYQPIVDVASVAVPSVEALVRWRHPRRGLVPPLEFIPLAEDTGLILPLGEWIVRTACAQVREWRAAGHPHLRVSVNISARQLRDPALYALIAQTLRENDLPPSALELEVIERSAVQDVATSTRTLKELAALGVRISIDDFGNHYSTLGNLRRFPFSTLKIDRSFVRDVTDDANTAAITKAIIAMARALNLRVIAEGVESPAQVDFLQQQQCDGMQGYIFSRPLPPASMSEWLRGRAAA